VSEGSAENIFLFLNNELVTPPPSENILLGITRDTVMQLARRELDRITRERVIDRTELYGADEIILTGTGAQVCPVIEVDHRPVGSGKIGPLGEELQRIYGEVVRGKRADYMTWCTPVFGGATRPADAPKAVEAATQNGHTSSHAAHHGNGRKSPAAAAGRSVAEKASKTSASQA
jgi:branched-chain amino acid aminotransferase